MKLFYSVILMAILSIPFSGRAQFRHSPVNPGRTDTILVTFSRTTYLAFPADIDLVDIGNKDFVFKVEKNILLLKCMKPGAKPTNMLVKYGQELFTASLFYTEKAGRSLYDYRKKIPGQSDAYQNFNRETDSTGFNAGSSSETSAGPAGMAVPEKRIRIVGALKQHFKTYGTMKSSIAFLLENIVSDEKFMYLQFRVKNKSHLNYTLDYVSFEYKKYGSRLPTKAFEPVYIPPNTAIPAHTEQVLVYVIPLFASGSDGQFTVTFRETLGNRRAILHIPTRAVRSALIFSHDLIE